MNKDIRSVFAERLKLLRKSKGLTQKQMADIIDISHKSLSHMKTHKPSLI